MIKNITVTSLIRRIGEIQENIEVIADAIKHARTMGEIQSLKKRLPMHKQSLSQHLTKLREFWKGNFITLKFTSDGIIYDASFTNMKVSEAVMLLELKYPNVKILEYKDTPTQIKRA